VSWQGRFTSTPPTTFRSLFAIRLHLTRAANRIVSHFTESVDIVPTILEWLEGAVSPASSTETFAAFASKKIRTPGQFAPSPISSTTSALFQQPAKRKNALGIGPEQCNLQVIRDQSHKYVAFHGLPPLLFDLKSDPFEFRNVLEIDRRSTCNSLPAMFKPCPHTMPCTAHSDRCIRLCD